MSKQTVFFVHSLHKRYAVDIILIVNKLRWCSLTAWLKTFAALNMMRTAWAVIAVVQSSGVKLSVFQNMFYLTSFNLTRKEGTRDIQHNHKYYWVVDKTTFNNKIEVTKQTRCHYHINGSRKKFEHIIASIHIQPLAILYYSLSLSLHTLLTRLVVSPAYRHYPLHSNSHRRKESTSALWPGTPHTGGTWTR